MPAAPPRRPLYPLLRDALAVVLACAACLAAAYSIQLNFSGPLPSEYAARRGPDVQIMDAGEFDPGTGPLRCGRVPVVLDPGFEDYAAAFFGFLIVNPERFLHLPPVVQRFAFAHECGHQFVGYSEIAADCHAARLGRREGWLGPVELEEVCNFFLASKGSPFHLPGPQRCAAIRACYAE
jgi:hypothetical protein